MRDQIINLVTRHCDTIRQEAAQIHSGLADLTNGTPEDNWDRLVRKVHTLKGSSGSLGFSEVYSAAALLEARMRAAGLRGARDQVHEIRRLDGALQASVMAIQPETSSLLQRFA
jgi:HPt (histidine-containing phosphotransfer) domain-containing protein